MRIRKTIGSMLALLLSCGVPVYAGEKRQRMKAQLQN